MKSQITKIVSLLVCVCLIVSGMILSTSAAESSTTISFADKAQRTSYSTTKQVWEQNGITVTNEKSSSTNNVGDYANPGRFYKGSKTTVAYPGMTKLVIDSTGAEAKYVAWDTSFSNNNATASVANNITTITFATPVDSFTFSSMSAQCRANSMTVYYESAGGDGDDNTGAGGTTPTPTPTPTDPADGSTLTIAQAIELADSKANGTYTTNKYYVEGKIKNVYNTEYGNMYIEDAAGNEFCIYGTYSADGQTSYKDLATKPVAGDTIKVYGVIGNYYNANSNTKTLQMKNGWIVEHTKGTPPVNNDPAADSVLTVKAAIELGLSKSSNVFTEYKYYVTGEITEIYNEQYGNMRIKDAEGNILTLYGTYNEDGSVRFDALTEKPAVGDTVTVYGIIGQFNNTPQMKNGWFKAAPAGDDNQGGNTDDNQGGNTNTGAGTNTGANTNTNTNTNTGSTTTTTPAPEKSPETGDSIALYIVMMAISAAAMVLVAKKRFA